MKNVLRYITLLTIIIAEGITGCSNDSANPTDTAVPKGENVIVVDAQSANAVSPPCGTTDAVCGTITDGLRSAALLDESDPILWIKSGTYDQEPEYPVRIQIPITLQAEIIGGAKLVADGTTLSLEGVLVTIEGCHFQTNSSGVTNAVVVQGGNVTFSNSTIINIAHPAEPTAIGLVIQDGANVTLTNSRVESTGVSGVKVVNGKLTAQHSVLIGDSEALTVEEEGVVTLENSEADGLVFTTGGSLTLTSNYTKSISIADGGYLTLTGNTIRGGVSLLWKQAYANMTENIVYGRVSAIEARADLDSNIIHGNDEGEGITAFNFSEFTLNDNTIFGAQYALYAQPYSAIRLSGNSFNSSTPGTPTIQCDDPVSVETDATSILSSPELTISCEGLPSQPGTGMF